MHQLLFQPRTNSFGYWHPEGTSYLQFQYQIQGHRFAMLVHNTERWHLVEFKFGDFLKIHQIAKLRHSPKFSTIYGIITAIIVCVQICLV